MAKDKIDTFSFITGLLALGFPFIYFTHYSLWVNIMIGVVMALVMSGIIRLGLLKLSKESTQANNKAKEEDNVTLYIITPVFLFVVQLVNEVGRADSFSFDVIMRALGLVGFYYLGVHLYHYFLKEVIEEKVSKRMRSYGAYALIVVLLITIVILSIVL